MDKPLSLRFQDKWIPEPFSGCWLWAGALGKRGYGKVSVAPTKCIFAHRASWILYHGSIPGGMHVLHKCDTPLCVNPSHLFLGTQLDNMRDCIAKGRRRNTPGESHGKVKLREPDVLLIRASRESQAILAARFGVHVTSIAAVRERRSWRHLPPTPDDWLTKKRKAPVHTDEPMPLFTADELEGIQKFQQQFSAFKKVKQAMAK